MTTPSQKHESQVQAFVDACGYIEPQHCTPGLIERLLNQAEALMLTSNDEQRSRIRQAVSKYHGTGT